MFMEEWIGRQNRQTVNKSQKHHKKDDSFLKLYFHQRSSAFYIGTQNAWSQRMLAIVHPWLLQRASPKALRCGIIVAPLLKVCRGGYASFIWLSQGLGTDIIQSSLLKGRVIFQFSISEPCFSFLFLFCLLFMGLQVCEENQGVRHSLGGREVQKGRKMRFSAFLLYDRP